jgi:hypothetical protein
LSAFDTFDHVVEVKEVVVGSDRFGILKFEFGGIPDDVTDC